MRHKKGWVGDVWTWVARNADTKLVPSLLVGGRDAGYGTEFLQDLASRLMSRVQLASDGHKVYFDAVEDAFGSEMRAASLKRAIFLLRWYLGVRETSLAKTSAT